MTGQAKPNPGRQAASQPGTDRTPQQPDCNSTAAMTRVSVGFRFTRVFPDHQRLRKHDVRA
jgi:hypothetical protein